MMINPKSLNGKKIDDMDLIVTKDMAISDKYIIVRRGKKKYYLGNY